MIIHRVINNFKPKLIIDTTSKDLAFQLMLEDVIFELNILRNYKVNLNNVNFNHIQIQSLSDVGIISNIYRYNIAEFKIDDRIGSEIDLKPHICLNRIIKSFFSNNMDDKKKYTSIKKEQKEELDILQEELKRLELEKEELLINSTYDTQNITKVNDKKIREEKEIEYQREFEAHKMAFFSIKDHLDKGLLKKVPSIFEKTFNILNEMEINGQFGDGEFKTFREKNGERVNIYEKNIESEIFNKKDVFTEQINKY